MADTGDIFKKPPLRYLGYANEVGEAFRGVVPNYVVVASYGVATAYVVAHTFNQFRIARKDADHRKKYVIGADTFVWQMLASVIMPGFAINRSCYIFRLLLQKSAFKYQQVLVTSFGLALIPFIISPIDKSVDLFLNVTFRRYMGIEGHFSDD